MVFNVQESRQGPSEEVGQLTSDVWEKYLSLPFSLALFPLLSFSPFPSLHPPQMDFLAVSLNKKLIMGNACSWSLG